MHKSQKKHSEIRGYVKRVFIPGPLRRFIPAKKGRGLKNLCFLLFIKFPDRKPAFLP